VLTGRARVIAAILAYTGIRPQELAGLDWADYDGDWLHIRRAVWQGKVVDVKTEESAANIPTVQPLREILDAYRATVAGVGWLISGDTAQPINLGNVARREVRPVLKRYGLQWKTWYGFRRGAATILADDLNLTEDEVRAILRHAPGSTTARDHYIVRQDRKRQAVMQKEEHIAEVRERMDRPVLVS
jgi:integrase